LSNNFCKSRTSSFLVKPEDRSKALIAMTSHGIGVSHTELIRHNEDHLAIRIFLDSHSVISGRNIAKMLIPFGLTQVR